MPTLSSAPLTVPINIGSTADGNALTRSPVDISPQASVIAIQGAQGYANLYFSADSGVQGVPPVNQRVASGVAIIFTGKPTDDIDATTLLFQALDFAEEQDANGLYFYQAFLDLDKTEIATAFAAIDSSTLSCAVDINLQVAAAGGAPAMLGIYRVTVQLLRQVYTGAESSPTPATPAYPSPATIATAIAQAAAAAAAVTAITFQNMPSITSAAGGGAATDLSAVETSTTALYSSVLIREYVTSPGVGLTTWVLELVSDPVGSARECPAHSTVSYNPARVWRQRS